MWSYIIQFLFSLLSETRMHGFKAFLLRLRGFKIGQNVQVVSSVDIAPCCALLTGSHEVGLERLSQ